MSALLAAALRLERVLHAENAALSALDMAALPALLAEKSAAAAALAAAEAPSRTPDLAAAAGRVRALAEENRRLLERAIGVQDQVLRLVAAAARQAGLRDAARYGAAGRPVRDAGAVALVARA